MLSGSRCLTAASEKLYNIYVREEEYRQMFEVICKELTPERRRILVSNEVAYVGKPIRILLAVGGVFLVYYGINGEALSVFQSATTIFSVVGIVAVLLAVFSQKLVEMRYFANALKAGCFPSGVSVGEGGIFVRRADRNGESGKTGVTSVNAEHFFAYAEIGKIEEFGEYFKMSLLSDWAPGVFLFKEDFEQGGTETFISFVESKKPLSP